MNNTALEKITEQVTIALIVSLLPLFGILSIYLEEVMQLHRYILCLSLVECFFWI